MKYVIIKVDTTGLSPDVADVVHISAIRVDEEHKATFDKFVNPGYHIPEAASEISNIFDEDVKDCPCFNDIKNELLEFIGDYPIIGHNIKFDLGFINKNLDAPLQNKSMSLMDMARACGYNGSLKFMALCKYYGVPYFMHYSTIELTDMLFNSMINYYKQKKDNKDA